MTHNPFVEVSKDTTTLYASDGDIFLFLVDDAHPIEAGRLPNGDPDLYFAASIAGTARSARRRSAWRASQQKLPKLTTMVRFPSPAPALSPKTPAIPTER